MSEKIEIKDPSEDVTQAASNAGSSQTDSFGKISSGPAALAALLIYQIQTLCAEIQNMSKEQKINMIESQSKAARAQADATVSGALWAGATAMASGAVSLAGSLGVAAAATKKGNTADIEKKIKVNNTEIDKLKAIDGLVTNDRVLPLGAEVGDPDPLALPGEQEEILPRNEGETIGDYRGRIGKNSEEIAKFRLREFKNEDFSRANEDPKALNLAVRHMKADPNYAEFKQEYRRQLNQKLQANNILSQELFQKVSSQNLMSTQGNQIVSGLGSGIQGVGTMQKGEQDALVSLNSTTSAQAADNVRDFAQQLSKAYETSVQEIQILENIQRSGSVNA